jgi:hypothetical protein
MDLYFHHVYPLVLQIQNKWVKAKMSYYKIIKIQNTSNYIENQNDNLYIPAVRPCSKGRYYHSALTLDLQNGCFYHLRYNDFSVIGFSPYSISTSLSK